MVADTISPYRSAETKTKLPPPDPPRDWYFTFGHGHKLHVAHQSSAEVAGAGVDIDGYYVVIHGTFHGARERMVELFGPAWSFQYSELPELADLPGGPHWHELIRIAPRPVSDTLPRGKTK